LTQPDITGNQKETHDEYGVWTHDAVALLIGLLIGALGMVSAASAKCPGPGTTPIGLSDAEVSALK